MTNSLRPGSRDTSGVSDRLGLLRKRWPLILLLLVLGLAVAGADIAASTKSYRASAQIFVAATTPATSTNDALNAGNSFVEARVQSYTAVATSPSVTSVVRAELHLVISDRQLASKITADAPLNKVLVNIHVSDGSPAQAARIANAVAGQFIVEVQNVETSRTTTGGGVVSPVKLTVIHPALPPLAPVAPQKKLIVLAGLLGGLVVGLAIVFALDKFDTRVRTPHEVEELTTSPVLAIIPQDKNASKAPMAIQNDSHGARSEAFRRLRTNLQFVGIDRPPRVIAVSSGSAGDGKTAVALNLASSLAEASMSVCLVETDLRRPSIAAALGLQPEAGLTSVLVGLATLDEVVQDLGHGLHVLCSGQLPPNPSELLATAQFGVMVADLASRYDYVILDTAPLVAVADGAEVASVAEATLVVVRAGKTRRETLTDAIQAVNRVNSVVAGVVLNRASKRDAPSYNTYRPRGAVVQPSATHKG